MAITTSLCNSFKEELLKGVHNFESDIIKVALIKAPPTGDYGAATTNYSDLGFDEAVGAGYLSGGQALDNTVVTLSGSTAFVDFDDEVILSATVSADGCLLYNSTKAGRAIAVVDFGETKTSTNGDFIIKFPTPTPTTAVLRFS